jgi:hypothetical protein
VHDRAAAVREEKIEEWIADIQKRSNGQGVDVQVGTVISAVMIAAQHSK